MSDREKLTEMIQESTGCVYCGDVCIDEEIDIDDQEIARIVDHLITNGVTVQVHGEWIPHDRMTRSPLVKNYACSNCGVDGHRTNYCPNCGAKMKAGDQNE